MKFGKYLNTALDGFALNSKETINANKKKKIKFKILKTFAAGDNPNIKKIKNHIAGNRKNVLANYLYGAYNNLCFSVINF